MWNRKVFVRIIEVLLCVACVVALRVTDDESRRVFHYLRNRSREWSLLNNVTWGTIGAALATATCGGYVIITTGLLIAAATGELRGRKTELFLLGLGIILFGIVGALSLASIDSVPEDLVDNAAVLGALCLVTALVFIADLLMRPPGTKKKHDGTQTSGSKDQAKPSSLTTLKSEKEDDGTSPNGKPLTATKTTEEMSGSVNSAFQKTDTISEKELKNQKPERGLHSDLEHEQRLHRSRSSEALEENRNRRFDEVERQLKEYSQNFDRSQNSRNSQRFRETETRRNLGRGVFYENERFRETDNDRFQFRSQDTYTRPLDDLDTPLFPTNLEARKEPIFAKIINPGVKIMKVERDFEERSQDYRCSDSSQYDNVPTRMMKSSPGILKKNHDVTFNVSPLPNMYKTAEKKDERFGTLRMTTGTQTGSNRDLQGPSSPTDPGYVRHTASNWPHELRAKTPSASPDHSKN